MAMFPVLQWRYRNDELMSEIVPQLAYGIEGKTTTGLGRFICWWAEFHMPFWQFLLRLHWVSGPTSGSSV